MKIGFIGYGEAAFNISLGLGREGITGIRATDAMMNHEVMGKQVHSRAQEAGVTLVGTNKEIAQWADIVFAAVPSSFQPRGRTCISLAGSLPLGPLSWFTITQVFPLALKHGM